MRHPFRVTILGSCRQDSLYKLFKVSKVRDGLTYPHSSGEVLQVLKYLANSKDGGATPLYCFRNYQIGARILSRKRLRKEFASSDLIVIEISSRLTYRHKGFYIHHEWFDTKENQTISSISRNDVTVLVEDDAEIEKNFSEILSYCDGKRVLLVTHLSSHQSGKRYELAQLLREIGARHNVEVFDPSSILNLYPLEKIMVQESVLSHFTEFGHEIVGGRLENRILDTLNRPKLVQIVSNSEERERKIGSHGIGDSIYGSITLHQEARRLHRPSFVDTSGHSLSNFLQTGNDSLQLEGSSIVGVFHESTSKMFKDIDFCFTNKKPRYPVTASDKDFAIRSFFDFNSEAIAMLEKQREQSLLPDDYGLVHLRFGDELLFGSSSNHIDLTRLFSRILEILEEEELDTSSNLFLSDSVDFQEFLRNRKLLAAIGPIGHAGKSNFTTAQSIKMLIDLSFISRAKVIYQASAYSWGSGFSGSVAQVFDIEVRQLDRLSAILRDFRESGDHH